LLKSGSARPLSDVTVVDFSHVIASPVVGRTLAEHGALVIKVVTKKRPRRALFDEEANSGKVPVELDLTEPADLRRLHSLLAYADVVIDGYTDGVLARYAGLSEEALTTTYPDLVLLKVSCYGHVGPLAKRKGFQQNANFATGVGTVADEESLGYQLVSQVDYATGYLGALGVVLALTDRQALAQEYADQAAAGGGFGSAGSGSGSGAAAARPPFRRRRGSVVRASLCQTATWMAQFGSRLPSRLQHAARITRLLFGLGDRMVTAGGSRYLPAQGALSLSLTPPSRAEGFHRWWADGVVPKL